MKIHITGLINHAIKELQAQGVLDDGLSVSPQVEQARDNKFGDFASNIALMLAKPAKRKPRELAELLVKNLPASGCVAKVNIAGPGFINFFLTPQAQYEIIKQVFAERDDYGRSTRYAGQRIHVEFVSANPTGPLHVGHGRSAAYGAALADVLAAVGYQVHREYYLNDAGRQMNILAVSVWLRYLELCGEDISFPCNGYKGDYVIAIAQQLQEQCGAQLRHPSAAVFSDLPADACVDEKTGEVISGDKEANIDALIERAKTLLGATDYQRVFAFGLDTIRHGIQNDLAAFGVQYQQWYSERGLAERNAITDGIERLRAAGYTYERGGALWFQATSLGDEKDRVLVRENGQSTYFASDVAYHLETFSRGYDRVIDVLGSDHHGYVPRIKAFLQAAGIDVKRFASPLVQFAILYRGKERVQMSTRSGEFVTLRELCDEVGKDAARFFYVMRKHEQHMDFDLELAKSQSNDNPVYYIQYAHARVSSVMRQLQDKQIEWDAEQGMHNLNALQEEQEKSLLKCMARYPEIVHNAARDYEPHIIAHYLRELAHEFHSYYNAHQFIVTDASLRNARICLIQAVQQVLKNGLTLLGVSAPTRM